jgi:hypothetical protein
MNTEEFSMMTETHEGHHHLVHGTILNPGIQQQQQQQQRQQPSSTSKKPVNLQT